MTYVVFDDVTYNIEMEDTDYNFNHYTEFYDQLDILLTDRQRKLFIEDETQRRFQISAKRISKFLNQYQNDEE